MVHTKGGILLLIKTKLFIAGFKKKNFNGFPSMKEIDASEREKIDINMSGLFKSRINKVCIS